jgi:hypothetical protein
MEAITDPGRKLRRVGKHMVNFITLGTSQAHLMVSWV